MREYMTQLIQIFQWKQQVNLPTYLYVNVIQGRERFRLTIVKFICNN